MEEHEAGILDGSFAFKFSEKRSDFRRSRKIPQKISRLGLFGPESLYLLAAAHLKPLGFVLASTPSQSLIDRNHPYFSKKGRISRYPIDSMEDTWLGFVSVEIHVSN